MTIQATQRMKRVSTLATGLCDPWYPDAPRAESWLEIMPYRFFYGFVMQPSMTTLETFRTRHHRDCIVCGPAASHGLGLACRVSGDNEVVAEFDRGELFQGYTGILHGGVISSLLDGAMTNCLFAHGRAAMTAELHIQFRHPVSTDSRAIVRAWIVETRPPFNSLEAELVQCEQVKARATGRFVDCTDSEREMTLCTPVAAPQQP